MGPSHIYSRNRRRYTSIFYCCNHDYCNSNRNQGLQMASYNLRVKNKINPLHAMIHRIYLPIYNRGPDWNLPIKLINRHHSSRYILRSGPLPLRTKNRSSICNLCRHITLISPLHRNHTTPTMNKNSIYNNIYYLL